MRPAHVVQLTQDNSSCTSRSRSKKITSSTSPTKQRPQPFQHHLEELAAAFVEVLLAAVEVFAAAEELSPFPTILATAPPMPAPSTEEDVALAEVDAPVADGTGVFTDAGANEPETELSVTVGGSAGPGAYGQLNPQLHVSTLSAVVKKVLLPSLLMSVEWFSALLPN